MHDRKIEQFRGLLETRKRDGREEAGLAQNGVKNIMKGTSPMKLVKLWEADMKKAYELQNSFRENENGFINAAFGYTLEEFEQYVRTCEAYSRGENLPEGYVPDTRFILENEDGDYVGIFNLRHCLNDFLANGPGHIGYGISSKFRRKGYATKGLALILQEAKKLGIEEAYLSANKDNTGSVKAQLNNGAQIHREDDKKYYTRIKLCLN